LNCNADSVAQAIALGAAALAPTDLVFCFEKRGVLRDADNDDSVIDRITPEIYATLREEGIVSGGMIPKIENALNAVAAGVRSVRIKCAEELLEESGTTIINQ
ncbi:MAG: acetylglutamate kinase, partial [Alistipes sp.]|nr:acetylglutamate kinase [Alistipes sp.]